MLFLVSTKLTTNQPVPPFFRVILTSPVATFLLQRLKTATEVKPEDPREAKNYFKARDKSLTWTWAVATQTFSIFAQKKLHFFFGKHGVCKLNRTYEPII